MGYGRPFTQEETEEVLDRLERGARIRPLADELGRDRSSIRRIAARAGYSFSAGRGPGGAYPRSEFPPEWVEYEKDHRPQGRRLGLRERTIIEIRRAEGCSHKSIAEEIGCSGSTVTREINRHATDAGVYFARRAQRAATDDAHRPKVARLDANLELRSVVVWCLNKYFSPTQIGMYLRAEYPGREDMRVSHETIYQALYVQGRGSLRQELAVEKALRSGRTRRIPQSRFPRDKRGKRARTWVEGCHISTRPAEVEDRAVPGHWEGDLVLGTKNQSAIITLVERASRYAMLRRLVDGHGTGTVMPVLIEMVTSMEEDLRKTLTWDQGDEMSTHRLLTDATGMDVYFCDPHAPWQRGSNENTNGLIRDFFPKGTNFDEVTDAEIQDAQDMLNMRPRATLDGHTPADVLASILSNQAVH